MAVPVEVFEQDSTYRVSGMGRQALDDAFMEFSMEVGDLRAEASKPEADLLKVARQADALKNELEANEKFAEADAEALSVAMAAA